MEHIYDFEQQLALGKKGEEKVFFYLNNLSDTILVEDLSNVKKWQPLGVDGILVSDQEDGPYCSIFFDVKTDFNYHRTGKLFIEVSTNNYKSGLLSTKANYFYYYDPYGGDLFQLPIYQMTSWYRRIGISMDHLTVKNSSGSEASGLVVSPYDLETSGVILNKVNIGVLEDIYQTKIT